MQSHLSAAHFHSEEAAYEYVEARLWPNGPICPHCGATSEQVGRLRGKTNRIGLCKCYACRKPFTAKVLDAAAATGTSSDDSAPTGATPVRGRRRPRGGSGMG